jgi:WD40 repeat protein
MWSPQGSSTAKIGAFSAISISSDGQFLAAGTSAGWVSLFRLNPTLTEIAETAVHSKGINCLCFSKDCQFIITCSDDKTVVALRNSPNLPHICAYEGSIAKLLTCDISGRNDKIVAAGFDTMLHLWATTQTTQIGSISAHTDVITAVQFTANGQYVLTASLDGLARIWSLKRMSVLRTYFWRAQPITGARFLPSEVAFFAAYGGDRSALLVMAVNRPSDAQVDPMQGTEADVMAKFVGGVHTKSSPAIYVGNGEIVTTSDDGRIRAWIFETQEEAWTLEVGDGGPIKMAMSVDSQLLATADVAQKKVTVWRRELADQ